MNLFVQTNGRKMEACIHRLETLRMKNSPDINDVDLPEVIGLIKGLVNELNNIQSENDKLTENNNG